SRRRHTRSKRDWSSDVCSSDLGIQQNICPLQRHGTGAFGKPLIPTNAHPNVAEAGFPRFKASVAGAKIILFLVAGAIGNVALAEIGRASCRERVWREGGGRGRN